jgi:hypothetical protein
MKIRFLTILLITFAIQTAFAQTERQIKAIRNEVNLINKNAKSYTKTVGNVDGISLEGTEATYFVSGRGLKKITAKMYGETYNATAELYYSGEELIFAYQKMNRYDTQIGMTPPPKVVSVKEERFYFAGGQLIKLLVGKINVKKDSKQWENSLDGITDLDKKLREAFPEK